MYYVVRKYEIRTNYLTSFYYRIAMYLQNLNYDKKLMLTIILPKWTNNKHFKVDL